MEIADYVEALFGPGIALEDLAQAYAYQWAVLLLLPWLVLGPYLMYLLLGLPLRRKERARLFLDLLEQGLSEGRTAEEVVRSISESCEPLFDPWSEFLQPSLRQGESLDRALAHAPGFLPSSITVQLQIGGQVGEVRRVIPACRRLLADARSEVMAGFNYFLLLTFALVPMSLLAIGTIRIWVLPKLRDIGRDMVDSPGLGTDPAAEYIQPLAGVQLVLLLLVIPMVLSYLVGPELGRRFRLGGLPLWDLVADWIPWARQRMRRDFASGLATLLDAGVPEATAVAAAARCAGNVPFERRARRVLRQLEQGSPLGEALTHLDRAGELRWRLENSGAGRGSFCTALEGWIERLDALAFRQQQGLTQLGVSLLLTLNAVSVGLIALSVFGFVIRLLDLALLW
ncbi:MAG: type II secretion system F family protein [Verrucomicrobiales bacterium]|nr:type II secretion system F family protein [Verrucomicrobiales bacterium]